MQKVQKHLTETIKDVKDTNDTISASTCTPCVSLEKIHGGTSAAKGFVFEDQDRTFTLLDFLQDLEDSEDSESLLDFTCNPESDSDLDEELEDSAETQSHYSEVKTPSDLDRFSKILAEAQRIAVEAENERIKEKNRPKQYLKNSA